MRMQQPQRQVRGVVHFGGMAIPQFKRLAALPVGQVARHAGGHQVRPVAGGQVAALRQQGFGQPGHGSTVAPADCGEQFDPAALQGFQAAKAWRATDALPQFPPIAAREQRVDRARDLVERMKRYVEAFRLAAFEQAQPGYLKVLLQRTRDAERGCAFAPQQEVARVVRLPEIKERLFNSGVEVIASSPAQLAAKMKSEMVRMGKVIRDAKIRDE